MRLIKPKLIPSHDWHVQPNFQRSLWVDPPERDPRIESLTLSPECPRTCMRLASCGFRSPGLPFWRELFKTIELYRFGQALFFRSPIFTSLYRPGVYLSQREQTEGEVFSAGRVQIGFHHRFPPTGFHQDRPCENLRAAQNFKRSAGATNARAAHGSRGDNLPGSCNGLFSAGFPTGALDRRLSAHIWPSEPASHSCLADLMAYREAPLLISNFSRVAQAALSCNSLRTLCFRSTCDPLATDSEYPPEPSLASLPPVGNGVFLWESKFAVVNPLGTTHRTTNGEE